MSSETETVEDDSASESSVLDIWEDWYHVPVLSVLIAFMFWVRVRARENFTGTGEVLFRGNDAYYHYREVQYTVNNWPWTMNFDPWTHFPYGNASGGQFGSLFDQIVATAALVVGFGDPSAETVRTTLLYAPAVFGTLMAIPIYYLGKHYAGRLGGVFGVFVLALLPGTVLSRATTTSRRRFSSPSPSSRSSRRSGSPSARSRCTNSSRTVTGLRSATRVCTASSRGSLSRCISGPGRRASSSSVFSASSSPSR